MFRWRNAFAIALCSLSFRLFLQGVNHQRNPRNRKWSEHGKFILHKFEQPIGEETFDTTREAQSLVTKVSFKFVDRGTAVPLTATFRSSDDLTPQAFEIKGKPARPTEIDEAVEIPGGQDPRAQSREMD